MFKRGRVPDSCERESGMRSAIPPLERSLLSSGFYRARCGRSGEAKEVNLMLMRFYARLRGEEGQAMVEYALILALVSVVSVIALGLIGTNVTAIFDAIANKLATVPLPV
jgi:pilus assembly protein Flp/PilA